MKIQYKVGNVPISLSIIKHCCLTCVEMDQKAFWRFKRSQCKIDYFKNGDEYWIYNLEHLTDAAKLSTGKDWKEWKSYELKQHESLLLHIPFMRFKKGTYIVQVELDHPIMPMPDESLLLNEIIKIGDIVDKQLIVEMQ